MRVDEDLVIDDVLLVEATQRWRYEEGVCWGTLLLLSLQLLPLLHLLKFILFFFSRLILRFFFFVGFAVFVAEICVG